MLLEVYVARGVLPLGVTAFTLRSLIKSPKLSRKGASPSARGVPSLVRKELPELSLRIKKAFKGPVRMRTLKAGERIYRSPRIGEVAEKPGGWFGTRRTITKVGTESQSYVRKYGNPLEHRRTYEVTKDVTVYYGRVKHGKGYQILFPEDIRPANVLKFTEEVFLK